MREPTRNRTEVSTIPKLRDSLDIREEQGRIELFGERFWLSHIAEFASFQKAQEAVMGVASKALVYDAGRRIGEAYHAFFRGALAGDLADRDPRGQLELLMSWTTRIGYGRFRVLDVRTDEAVLALEDSIEVESYGASKGPVCYSIAGIVGSLVGAVLGGRSECEERACAAAGAPRCEFVIRLAREASPDGLPTDG